VQKARERETLTSAAALAPVLGAAGDRRRIEHGDVAVADDQRVVLYAAI
jgi:hypothetical protein